MAKYPWGDEVFPMKAFPALLLYGVVAVGLPLLLVGPEGAVNLTKPVEMKSLGGVALVTVGWMAMFYTTLGSQVGLKFNPESTAEGHKIAERGMMNTLEQMGPFLLSLWLHALFVNPKTSAVLGWVYVVFRFFYTPLYGLYGQFTLAPEISTMPNYTVIYWFLCAVVWKLTKETDLHDAIVNVSPALVFVAVLVVVLIFQINMMLLPAPIVKTIIAGVQWEKAHSGEEEFSDEEEGAHSS